MATKLSLAEQAKLILVANDYVARMGVDADPKFFGAEELLSNSTGKVDDAVNAAIAALEAKGEEIPFYYYKNDGELSFPARWELTGSDYGEHFVEAVQASYQQALAHAPRDVAQPTAAAPAAATTTAETQIATPAPVKDRTPNYVEVEPVLVEVPGKERVSITLTNLKGGAVDPNTKTLQEAMLRAGDDLGKWGADGDIGSLNPPGKTAQALLSRYPGNVTIGKNANGEATLTITGDAAIKIANSFTGLDVTKTQGRAMRREDYSTPSRDYLMAELKNNPGNVRNLLDAVHEKNNNLHLLVKDLNPEHRAEFLTAIVGKAHELGQADTLRLYPEVVRESGVDVSTQQSAKKGAESAAGSSELPAPKARTAALGDLGFFDKAQTQLVGAEMARIINGAQPGDAFYGMTAQDVAFGNAKAEALFDAAKENVAEALYQSSPGMMQDYANQTAKAEFAANDWQGFGMTEQGLAVLKKEVADGVEGSTLRKDVLEAVKGAKDGGAEVSNKAYAPQSGVKQEYEIEVPR